MALLETTGSATLLVDPATSVILHVNQHFCHWVGIDRGEVEGKMSLLDFVAPEDRDAMRERFQERGRNPDLPPASIEIRGLKRDGGIEEISVNVRSIRNPPLIIYSVNDIGPIKEAVRNEAKYEVLIENCGACLFVLEKDLEISFVNQRFEQVTGYQSHEVLGKLSVLDLLSPESAQLVFQRAKARAEGNAEVNPEVALVGICKDGSARQLHVFSTPIKETGQILVSFLDITKRVRAEEMVTRRLQRESLLNQVARSLSAATEFNFQEKLVHTLSLIAEEFEVPCACFHMHEETREEFMKALYKAEAFNSQLDNWPEADRRWRELANAASTGMKTSNGLHVFFQQENAVRHLLILEREGQEAPDWSEADKEILHTLMALLAAVNERISAASRERALVEEIQRVQRLDSIGILSGGIAHDFNNILTAVIGNAELMQSELADGDPFLQGALEDVLVAGRRGKDLTAQILAFAKDSRGEVSQLDLERVCQEALRLLRASIPSNIEIKTSFEEHVPFLMQGDRLQLLRLLMNLCTNAYQAIEGHGQIEIRLRRIPEAAVPPSPHLSDHASHFACLEISDTGAGIEEGIQSKIFDPFFTTRDKHGGTGLGLSVVHRIVASHGGSISLRSSVGKGSTFAIYLPMEATAEENPRAPKEISAWGFDRQQLKVMVVDDETSILRILRTLLSRQGYQVTALQEGSEAIKLFRQNPEAWDLVITDMIMPQTSGRDVAEAIRAIRRDIPVVLCSGYSSPSQVATAEPDLFSTFMPKPFDGKKLIQLVDRLIGENEVENCNA